MSKNNNLHAAKTAKNDEFYTRFEDINDEINREEHGYVKHFKDSVVYCNCDDPEESNFWKFFKIRFRFFQMKKLIATHYSADKGASYKLEYDGESVVKTELKGNGDFRSEECVELLKESDVVVTNPPFSLFREFMELLMKYNKKFAIIGNKNAITYKEIFPLIKDNKLWLGYENPSKFITPSGEVTTQVQGLCRWFTNLDIPKRHVPINSKWKFETGIKMGIYQKYDNYDAWNVDKVAQIPGDYDGVLGVPITFLDRFCPEEFEIVNANDYRTDEKVPKKSHGLIKDKEATITERERENNLRSNLHQENCSHQELTDGILAENASMQEYSWYYDMVSRPIIKGTKIYRRVFIIRRKSSN